jgi:hypothetical protein
MTSAQVVVDDPQAIEALKTGAKAEVLFHVQGLTSREDLEVRQGKFQVVVSFGRVREK